MRSPLWPGMITVSASNPSYMLVWYIDTSTVSMAIARFGQCAFVLQSFGPAVSDQMCAPLYTTWVRSTSPRHISSANADRRACDRMRHRVEIIDNVGGGAM